MENMVVIGDKDEMMVVAAMIIKMIL